VTPKAEAEAAEKAQAAEAAEAEADQKLRAAEDAFGVYRRVAPEARAQLLEAIADGILALGDDLLAVADAETGLGLPRLTAERARTVGQLRLFAGLVREGSWVDARIDTADPARTPPKPDVRRLLIPIGPVVVFAASNFPLAFSVAGGDTASALAAGNPVVLRAHPAHPETSARVAAAVTEAVRLWELPAGVFALVSGPGHAPGLALVRHPLARAVAFTGSLRGGRALADAAAARPEPIPVFAEMGSTNPVFVLPEALAERGAALGTALADSATLGTGQFCTKPGLIFACAGPGFAAFAEALGARIAAKVPARMLYADLALRFREGVTALGRAEGVVRLGEAPDAGDAPGSARPVAWQVPLSTFLRAPALREELFGPSTLLVCAASVDELGQAAAALDGQLTATLHGTAADLVAARPLVGTLERKVGRLIFGGVPTGVEVCAAMNHGGPYPATTDARSTSVGTASILRFARALCYQDAAATVLPPELGDRNVRGIWRLVDNRLSRDDVRS
jgi:2,5-dioxopentanoate dehydrogenase